ncbi:hypothetical protein [Arthrobacter sp. SPG23]|nr:hypothetical protein [Arthrobacter sp. SPG23]
MTLHLVRWPLVHAADALLGIGIHVRSDPVGAPWRPRHGAGRSDFAVTDV